VSELLAPLRRDLDVMPSPVADRPGLLIRDPFRYSDAVMIVPPALARCLALFDGKSTTLDLREALFRVTGDIQVGALVEQLTGGLSEAGFLDDARFHELREAKHEAFRTTAVRGPTQAGSGYPGEPSELRAMLDAQVAEAPRPPRPVLGLAGIAAPHVSLAGGASCYAAAYACLGPELQDRTFVVLGTSHYGQPDRFGLTARAFSTPIGESPADRDLVDELARRGGEAVVVEDYCHAVEHSIELQVVFLQHVVGPGVRIVPILCGPLHAETERQRPDENEGVRSFLAALADIASREADRLFWVLGIDMAHVGHRYGGRSPVRSREGHMLGVEARDRERLARVIEADAAGFWALVREGGDDLNWCGSSAVYSFLRAVGGIRGELLAYDQWNIDEASVVTFAALAFRRFVGP
jgi:AmmeMemoRadiSam system protein B